MKKKWYNIVVIQKIECSFKIYHLWLTELGFLAGLVFSVVLLVVMFQVSKIEFFLTIKYMTKKLFVIANLNVNVSISGTLLAINDKKELKV
ncbi:MAG: hypothetical protein D4S01_11645 [Dehalococcoidia bacterium]|nr:MAG: hypothetical protein D4S01_11630 [Dehalococcoidia bacterium]TRZ47797.1 MAG: hypothetical protein D4S01_11645 [Dehalococcoidia bacterium]